MAASARKEARGTVAPAWEKAERSDLAAIAEREVAGTGWLPAPLRWCGLTVFAILPPTRRAVARKPERRSGAHAAEWRTIYFE